MLTNLFDFLSETLINVFLIAALFLVVGVIFMVIENKIKGLNDFNIFKKREPIDINYEYMLSALKKVEGYKIIKSYKDAFILFHERGIFLIKSLDYSDKIKGNIEDDELINWIDQDTIIEIPNFFKEIDALNKEVSKKIGQEITSILVKKELCVLEVKNYYDYNFISKTNVSYKLTNFIKTTNVKYKKDELKQLSKRV